MTNYTNISAANSVAFQTPSTYAQPDFGRQQFLYDLNKQADACVQIFCAEFCVGACVCACVRVQHTLMHVTHMFFGTLQFTKLDIRLTS